MATRVGVGYDSHRFAPGRPLVLGGVTIPHPVGLTGHSDADAVAHALTDAILGAAACGSIGGLFPDSDPRWKGADSMVLLHEAHAVVKRKGFAFVQGDITVIAEAPKVGPHAAAIAARLAEILEVSPDDIGIKGKTNEGMGFVGRGEGIACMATAMIEWVG
jgi:2-C-methyl-D-erythritol 2,4-cyclodiphosphate synthase